MQKENNFLESFFKLSERKSTLRTEIMAGITTFMTMAYILAVNPSILSAAGMDTHSVLAATAISAAIGSLVMGILANLPIALAPGMGLNAFFAFTVVIGMGYSWQFALTAVFLEGLIFIALTLTNLREAILNCIPPSLKKAISAGIGLFIAFIGMQSCGLVVANEATLVALGDISSPNVFLALIGLMIMGVLLSYKVNGALLFGIIATTLIGIPLGLTNLSGLNSIIAMPTLAPTFWQFEWHNILTFDMAFIVFTFLFVDLFDTLGTLIATVTKGELLEPDGTFPNPRNALLADSLATTFGAILGTSTVTAYVESTSGIAQGGRTGLTAITVGILFLVATLFTPLFLLIPAQATAPVLILVGLFMLEPLVSINFDDFVESIPAFLCLLLMPFAYSISTGILFGLFAFVILAIVTGRTKEVSPVATALVVLFVLKELLNYLI